MSYELDLTDTALGYLLWSWARSVRRIAAEWRA